MTENKINEVERGEGWKAADQAIEDTQRDLNAKFGVERPELIGPAQKPMTHEELVASAEKTRIALQEAREQLAQIGKKEKL